VDWQGGWYPTLKEGEQRLFIKPSRASWKPQMEGNTCTGYTVGKGHVNARIYNKTIQANKEKLDWYFTAHIPHLLQCVFRNLPWPDKRRPFQTSSP
jgi:hypothetical protein